MAERAALSDLPDLVLLKISEFIVEEDIARLSQTCRRLRALLPRFLILPGTDFDRVPGSGTWWGDLELYFDGPPLPSSVFRVTVSVAGWKDQGWGNQKGELFARLMRNVAPTETEKKKEDEKLRVKTKKSKPAISFFGRRKRGRMEEKEEEEEEEEEEVKEGEIIVERRDFFGLAAHEEQSAKLEMDRREQLVRMARPGDWYRFMRRIGGDGGHTLTVRGFKAIVTLNQ